MSGSRAAHMQQLTREWKCTASVQKLIKYALYKFYMYITESDKILQDVAILTN